MTRPPAIRAYLGDEVVADNFAGGGGASLGIELALGRGLMVMHLCDNRACVRPDHLRVGTASENNTDCVAKGRRVRNAVDVDQSPGRIEQRSPASAGGHLSRALEQLLPEPGAIAVGTAVELGGREGSVSAVLPGGRIAVRWLDGEVTDEALPGATTGR